MGLTREEADAYAKSVVQADFEEVGDEDVVRKLLADFAAANVDVSEIEVRAALEAKGAEAQAALAPKARKGRSATRKVTGSRPSGFSRSPMRDRTVPKTPSDRMSRRTRSSSRGS